MSIKVFELEDGRQYLVPARELINAIGMEPLFGHHSGKKSNTHWLCFMKGV